MNFLFFLLIISVCLSTLRFFKGPEWPDRIMVFDIFTNVLIASVILFAIRTNNKDSLGFALVSAMLAFVSTVALVFVLEKTKKE